MNYLRGSKPAGRGAKGWCGALRRVLRNPFVSDLREGRLRLDLAKCVPYQPVYFPSDKTFIRRSISDRYTDGCLIVCEQGGGTVKEEHFGRGQTW